MSFVHCHLHSDSSLQDGLSTPKKIVKKCADYGMPACALSDHGSLGGIPSFFREAKKAGIKPLLGIEAYTSLNHSHLKDDRKSYHTVIIAKNKNGWKNLLKIVAKSNSEESFYYKPRLSLEEIAEINNDHSLICVSGHPGSQLSSRIWREDCDPYSADTLNQAREMLSADFEENLFFEINRHIECFGKENLFIEKQRQDQNRLVMARLTADILGEFVPKFGLKEIATADPHYVDQQDAILQQIIVCDAIKTTFGKVHAKLSAGEEVGLGGFFKSNNYHILTPDEIRKFNTEEEIKNSLLLADMVEDHEISAPARCPQFKLPEGYKDSSEYLRSICYNNFNNMIAGQVDDESVYINRLEYELGVIEDAKISDYFLVVRGILEDARNRGKLTNYSRGSVGSSLTALLSDITKCIDPIKQELPFERFINPDRVKKGEYPDIDCDFQQSDRETVIENIRKEYGDDYVSQVCTYSSLKGRSALRTVLRAMGVSFQLQLEITEGVFDEAKVSDDLQEYANEHGEKSLVKLSLQDNAKKLERFAKLESDGTISGEYAEHFELASRIEYVRNHMGKHAAAVVIGVEPLINTVPMVRSKDKSMIVGWEYTDAEWASLLKIDILGLKTLDQVARTLARINKNV